MKKRDNDYKMLIKISKQNTEAYRHHADIMKYLESVGFKPNPTPQVDMAIQRTAPKQMYVNGL